MKTTAKSKALKVEKKFHPKCGNCGGKNTCEKGRFCRDIPT